MRKKNQIEALLEVAKRYRAALGGELQIDPDGSLFDDSPPAVDLSDLTPGLRGPFVDPDQNAQTAPEEIGLSGHQPKVRQEKEIHDG